MRDLCVRCGLGADLALYLMLVNGLSVNLLLAGVVWACPFYVVYDILDGGGWVVVNKSMVS